MKTWITFALCTAVCAGSLLNSHAAEGPLARRAAMREQLKEKLALTDEQTTQIKKELAVEKDSIRDITSRLGSARASLRDVIEKKSATEAEVRAAAEKVAAVESDAAVLRWKLHAKLAPILSDEQRTKLKQFDTRMDELIEKLVEKAGDRLNLQ